MMLDEPKHVIKGTLPHLHSLLSFAFVEIPQSLLCRDLLSSPSLREKGVVA